MSDPQNLKDLYVEEMQDLWSANDQMKSIVGEMANAASDEKLSGMFRRSATGIQEHTEMLKTFITEAGGESQKDHCKGMEGLVAEVKKHALEPKISSALRDVALIAQYQRMCHYGLAGFGTAKALAKALGMDEHAQKLDQAVDSIYESDSYMSELAERTTNLEAAAQS